MEEGMCLSSGSDSEGFESREEAVRDVRGALEFLRDVILREGFSSGTPVQTLRVEGMLQTVLATMTRKLKVEKKRGYDQAVSINRQQ